MRRCELLPRHFQRSKATRLSQRSVPVVQKKKILRYQRRRQRGECFVSLRRDVDPAPALAQQVLFPQVASTN